MANETKSVYREGYFMTADEQRTEKALLKLDYEEAKEREELLRHKIDAMAEGYANFGARLKKKPEEFFLNVESEVVKNYQELATLLRDLKETINEKQLLQRRLDGAGISYSR